MDSTQFVMSGSSVYGLNQLRSSERVPDAPTSPVSCKPTTSLSTKRSTCIDPSTILNNPPPSMGYTQYAQPMPAANGYPYNRDTLLTPCICLVKPNNVFTTPTIIVSTPRLAMLQHPINSVEGLTRVVPFSADLARLVLVRPQPPMTGGDGVLDLLGIRDYLLC